LDNGMVNVRLGLADLFLIKIGKFHGIPLKSSVEMSAHQQNSYRRVDGIFGPAVRRAGEFIDDVGSLLSRANEPNQFDGNRLLVGIALMAHSRTCRSIALH